MGKHAAVVPGSVAVVGAGDYIGGAIARRFATAGYHVFAGRRNGEKLAPLVAEIEDAGGTCTGLSLDARQENAVTDFMRQADEAAPLEVAVFNIGANVNFPLLETTERVFRKVWELACYAGFLTGREAARRILPHGKGSIFFTGATASVRGGSGYTAFAGAKFGLRAVAQSMARELGPQNIHVAHLVIDSGVDTEWVRQRVLARGGSLEDRVLMNPASIAETYWQLHQQPRDAWTHELDLRPYQETW
jgi:NAD(P)-dependent dehydrogenase (short-subunit alcohol dehydrogenase family)